MRLLVTVVFWSGLVFGSRLAHADPKHAALDGDWQGSLAVPGGGTLRLALHVTRDAQGALAAKLDSLDQGAMGLPVANVRVEGQHVVVTLKTPPAEFTGDLDEAGQVLTGQWHQGGGTLPLVFHRGSAADAVAERPRPQTPRPPFPYRAEEVAYDNTAAQVRLAGTLLIPEGAGPFPAALLITGSGPQDRDETLFGHKPFLVLADALARRGIAVLRVDDRGVAASTGTFDTATSEDFAGDAAAGVAYLQGRTEIDTHHIGLIGHSEGGLIGPMVAARNKAVAFVVMLAGPGLPGADILVAQRDLIARAMGETDEAALARSRDDLRRLFELIKREKDPAALEKKARALIEASIAHASGAEKKELGDLTQATSAQLARVLTPWFRYFLTYDPRPTLAKVRCPVLALSGEKDLQVPPKDNLPAVTRALKAGGNHDVTTREMPGLNHLFQTAKTGAPSEYASIDETMSPAVLAIIGDWILAHAKK